MSRQSHTIKRALGVAVLLTAGCSGGQPVTSTATPTASPGSGLELLNDTQAQVTLTGCRGCDAGIKVPAGKRYVVELKPNDIVLRLTSTGPERCLVVVNDFGKGDLLLRASKAAATAC